LIAIKNGFGKSPKSVFDCIFIFQKGKILDTEDKKIFIYLRLRDEKEIVCKSKIREFAGLSKLMMEFTRDVIERFGLEILRAGVMEYVDANTELILLSFKQDMIQQKIILSGLIPKEYQSRMLNLEEVSVRISKQEIANKISENLDPTLKAIIFQRIQYLNFNILYLIKNNINENGEFYVLLEPKNQT
jgi:hypothetical protein